MLLKFSVDMYNFMHTLILIRMKPITYQIINILLYISIIIYYLLFINFIIIIIHTYIDMTYVI